jgi:hypothetical protein
VLLQEVTKSAMKIVAGDLTLAHTIEEITEFSVTSFYSDGIDFGLVHEENVVPAVCGVDGLSELEFSSASMAHQCKNRTSTTISKILQNCAGEPASISGLRMQMQKVITNERKPGKVICQWICMQWKTCSGVHEISHSRYLLQRISNQYCTFVTYCTYSRTSPHFDLYSEVWSKLT